MRKDLLQNRILKLSADQRNESDKEDRPSGVDYDDLVKGLKYILFNTESRQTLDAALEELENLEFIGALGTYRYIKGKGYVALENDYFGEISKAKRRAHQSHIVTIASVVIAIFSVLLNLYVVVDQNKDLNDLSIAVERLKCQFNNGDDERSAKYNHLLKQDQQGTKETESTHQDTSNSKQSR